MFLSLYFKPDFSLSLMSVSHLGDISFPGDQRNQRLLLSGWKTFHLSFLFAVCYKTPISECLFFNTFVPSAYPEQGSVVSSEDTMNMRSRNSLLMDVTDEERWSLSKCECSVLGKGEHRTPNLILKWGRGKGVSS